MVEGKRKDGRTHTINWDSYSMKKYGSGIRKEIANSYYSSVVGANNVREMAREIEEEKKDSEIVKKLNEDCIPLGNGAFFKIN